MSEETPTSVTEAPEEEATTSHQRCQHGMSYLAAAALAGVIAGLLVAIVGTLATTLTVDFVDLERAEQVSLSGCVFALVCFVLLVFIATADD